MTEADKIINKVLSTLDLGEESPNVLYENLPRIMDEVDKANTKYKLNPKTTGTISERYAGWALEASIPESFYKLTGDSGWLGDYVLLGIPMPITLSVKSYTAKERAHTSGTGNYVAPSILFGLFKDEKEFNPSRLNVFRARGFLAIYMPPDTMGKLPDDSIETPNLYGRPLIRNFLKFPDNIKESLENLKLGSRNIGAINHRKL